MKIVPLFISILFLVSCNMNSQNENEDLVSTIPFKEIVPSDKLIHKGIYNPQLDEFYYILSDKKYQQFDIYMIKKDKNGWSKPSKAPFNSDFSDHGMSFSPNEKSIYFSSTRPTGVESVSQTWHIWKTTKIKDNWTDPQYIDIPNLKDKLVSHPIMTNKGNLFFHSSNLDYSQMDIYQSKEVDGIFQPAVKTPIKVNNPNLSKTTPYVSPDEEFILFASVEDQLVLTIAYNDGNGNWVNTKKLNGHINSKGQGNPWVTLDNKTLLYTTGNPDGTNWKINTANIENEILQKK